MGKKASKAARPRFGPQWGGAPSPGPLAEKAVIVPDGSGSTPLSGPLLPIEYDCRMVRRSHIDPQRVREEIAIAAARLIAEEGLDYASAKRKAARQVVGQARVAGEWLPDNDQIEEEIREYQSLFKADSQPLVLRRLREVALDWMKRLAEFNPYLTGAVLNGTAGEHSDIHLQVFCDNPKEVAMYLLNANVQYDVSETRHFGGRGTVETLSFLSREARDEEPIGMHVALYDTDDLRGAVRADARGRTQRANAETVEALLAEGGACETPAPSNRIDP
jgi:hypothetical protein